MQNSTVALLVFLVVQLGSPGTGHGHGGPPMLTDDTSTPGRNKWELLAYFTLDRRLSEVWFESPVLEVTYGIRENLAVTVGVPWTIWFRPGKTELSGLGNIYLALKWRFFELPKAGFAIAWTPQVVTNSPTSAAEQGIVAKGTSLQTPFQLQQTIGPVDLVLELGYRINQHSKDEWFWGFVVGWFVTFKLELLAEVFGLATSNFSANELLFNLGLLWQVHPNVSLFASAGRSFRRRSSGESNLIALLGVGVTID